MDFIKQIEHTRCVRVRAANKETRMMILSECSHINKYEAENVLFNIQNMSI